MLASTAAAAGLLLAVSAPTAQALPPKPGPRPNAVAKPGAAPTKVTQGQVDQASAAKSQVAAQVGDLGAQVAAKQAQLQNLQAKLELAEQKVALTQQQLEDAQATEKQAKAELDTVRQSTVKAQTAFIKYVQDSYMSGGTTGGVGTLLAATDPSDLLDQTSLSQYVSAAKLDAASKLQTLSVKSSNAHAKYQRAVVAANKAKKAAQQAQQDAAGAVSAAQAEKAELQASLTSAQNQLAAAQLKLATLNGQRTTYVAYQQAQAKFNQYQNDLQSWQTATDAYKAAVARQLAQQAAARAAAARAAAARKSHHSGGSGGGGGGSASINDYAPAAPSYSGSWTAAKGRAAANRALSQVGMPYIWAGGNKYGPTTGGCTDPVSPCGVVGFDCSGLALFAWGASWAHYTVTMYSTVGRHVSLSNLRVGDLIFYQPGDIHHVAIYIGGGRIVQAPYSGATVTTSSMYEPGPILGAVRPET